MKTRAMRHQTRRPAWEVVGDLHLKEAGPHGRYLFELIEYRGLGRDADRYLAMIAAAPELLAALKELMRTLSSRGGLPLADYQVAVSAINRAEGRA